MEAIYIKHLVEDLKKKPYDVAEQFSISEDEVVDALHRAVGSKGARRVLFTQSYMYGKPVPKAFGSYFKRSGGQTANACRSSDRGQA